MSKPSTLGRRAPALLASLAQTAAASSAGGQLNVVAFGSAVDGWAGAADIDLWVSGDSTAVGEFRAGLAAWSRQMRVPVDVVTPHDRIASDLAAALRWHASTGLAIIGAAPVPPPLTSVGACHAFQRAEAELASVRIARADLLGRIGLSSAADLTILAARLALRSRTTEPHQWRKVSRLHAHGLRNALGALEPALPRLIRRSGWAGPSVIDAVASIAEWRP
jgi:hypothetical protein